MSGEDRWRKPLLHVYHEEAYTVDERAEEERGLKHIVSGPDRFDNMGRLLKGLACSNCLTPFPAKPDLSTVELFKQLNYEGLRSEAEALALVAQGKCPICKWEVSLEMSEVAFMGKQSEDGSMDKK